MMEISLFVVAGVLMYASLFVAWRAVDALQRANRRLMNEVADLRARVWRLEADARKADGDYSSRPTPPKPHRRAG